MKLREWTRSHLSECAIFIVGVLLRVSMYWRNPAEWGYDADAHWSYILSLVDGHLPQMDRSYIAYHPPLYHAVAASLVKFGATQQGVTLLSVACGTVKLALIWFGLRRYLSDHRGRIAALTVAAVMPSSIMLDGMLGNEAMVGMFAVAAMILWPKVVEYGRWRQTLLLGVVLGLGMLSKTSTLVLLFAFTVAVVLTVFLPAGLSRPRLKTLIPCLAALTICVAISGWFYGRNVIRYGALFVTSYETIPGQATPTAPSYLDRRSLGFIFGWDFEIYQQPYYPIGLQPYPRFFPVAIAQTFVDYYNYSFSGLRPDQPSALTVNNRAVTKPLIRLSRAANLGGTIILLASLIVWAACLRRTVKQRDWSLFSLLFTPVLATLLALSFAVKYPYDTHGVVKGTYILFSAAPLYATFGLAVAWTCAHRRRWPAAIVLLLGLSAVTAYAVCCRTGLLIGSPPLT